MIGRLLCWLGRHDDAVSRGRIGYVTFRMCRRSHCIRYSIRKGWMQ